MQFNVLIIFVGVYKFAKKMKKKIRYVIPLYTANTSTNSMSWGRRGAGGDDIIYKLYIYNYVCVYICEYMYIHHYVHIIYTPQGVCIHIIYIYTSICILYGNETSSLIPARYRWDSGPPAPGLWRIFFLSSPMVEKMSKYVKSSRSLKNLIKIKHPRGIVPRQSVQVAQLLRTVPEFIEVGCFPQVFS